MTTPDSDTMTTPDSDIMTIPDLDITSTIGLKHADPQFDIPRLGFGVYRSPADVCRASCLEALRCGYRYIDTAQYYENEVQVGEAVRESGIPRDQIFISTKILFRCGSVEKTLERCRQSVKDIGLGCIDLFLIHSPSSGAEGREEMWRALEILKKEGGARAIGVSNYGIKHMDEIRKFSTLVPAVNQIELHPQCQQRPIVEYCSEMGIRVEAYCPLARGTYLNDGLIVELAKKHKATPAQILLRWSLQRDFIPLPKSDSSERIKENAGVYHFSLAPADMGIIDGMDKGQKGAIVPQYTECP